jgi:hypothetical protein
MLLVRPRARSSLSLTQQAPSAYLQAPPGPGSTSTLPSWTFSTTSRSSHAHEGAVFSVCGRAPLSSFLKICNLLPLVFLRWQPAARPRRPRVRDAVSARACIQAGALLPSSAPCMLRLRPLVDRPQILPCCLQKPAHPLFNKIKS